MYRIPAYILIVLGIIMIYLSVSIGALPPGITGIGFFVIAWVFLKMKSS